MKKRNDMYISELRCAECGSVFPIPRRISHRRENDHIKDLYCYRCARVTKFKENEKDDQP